MAPRTTVIPETVERPAALKGTELGVAVTQTPVEEPAAVVGVTRCREEVLTPAEVAAAQTEVAAQTVWVRVTVTVIAEEALAEEERPAATPEGRGLAEETGETPTADEGALVTAGAIQGAVVEATKVGMEDSTTEVAAGMVEAAEEDEMDPS